MGAECGAVGAAEKGRVQHQDERREGDEGTLASAPTATLGAFGSRGLERRFHGIGPSIDNASRSRSAMTPDPER